MITFNVTYEVVTLESAEQGEAADRGFHAEGVSLRGALNAIGHSTKRPGLEDSGRWFVSDASVDFQTGAETSYAIHPPRTVTPASYRRLARVLTR